MLPRPRHPRRPGRQCHRRGQGHDRPPAACERLREKQLTERRTKTEVELEGPPEPAEDAFLYREEIPAVFMSVAAATIESIASERAAALVLKQFEGDSFAALGCRLHRNHTLREALEDLQPEGIPDETTF